MGADVCNGLLTCPMVPAVGGRGDCIGRGDCTEVTLGPALRGPPLGLGLDVVTTAFGRRPVIAAWELGGRDSWLLVDSWLLAER